MSQRLNWVRGLIPILGAASAAMPLGKGLTGRYLVPSLLGLRLTRGQRPNESQKSVIIDVKESVGEIASKIWPVF